MLDRLLHQIASTGSTPYRASERQSIEAMRSLTYCKTRQSLCYALAGITDILATMQHIHNPLPFPDALHRLPQSRAPPPILLTVRFDIHIRIIVNILGTFPDCDVNWIGHSWGMTLNDEGKPVRQQRRISVLELALESSLFGNGGLYKQFCALIVRRDLDVTVARPWFDQWVFSLTGIKWKDAAFVARLRDSYDTMVGLFSELNQKRATTLAALSERPTVLSESILSNALGWTPYACSSSPVSRSRSPTHFVVRLRVGRDGGLDH